MAKILYKSIAALLLVLIVAFVALYAGDSDPQAMFAKYGQGAITIDAGAGGRLVYRDQGPKDAPVLLLVHGSNASMQTWNEFSAELLKDYRVISFDQHGHGLSGPHAQADYSAAAKITAALAVLDHAQVERAVWVGNSMGGWLSWRAALAEPDRVSKIVLIDASGAQVAEKIEPYFAAKLSRSWFGQLIAPYITPRFLISSSLEQNYANPAKIDDALIDTYWEMIRFPGNRRAIAPRAAASREPEAWQQISELSQPTLLLWGAKDTVIPVSHAKAFKKEITGSELVIYPNAGHLPHEEIPVAVANDVRNWLESTAH